LAKDTLAAMSLEQKAAQLIMVPLTPSTDLGAFAAKVQERQPGAVLLLENGWNSVDKVRAATAALRDAAPESADLWIAVDQEGGQVQRLSGGGFDTIPSGVNQGQMSLDDLQAQAAVWGGQLAGAGVNLDLAPVVDWVDPAGRRSNAPIGAMDRDYGLDAAGNGEHAGAFIAGMRKAGVGTAVKHFPGLGLVTGNTDFTATGIVDTATGTDSESVKAFADTLRAEPTMVMMALATYERIDSANPAALSSVVVQELLRGQLGWQGVVISDSLTAAAVSGVSVGDRVTRFVEAGGDVACFGSASDAWAALDALIAQGKAEAAFAQLIDQSALRVLSAKAAAGLV
jgi:beta-N-acetylhexosaminidase